MRRLHSIQSGQGPVLVILHGLFGSVDNFRSTARLLEDSFSVLRIDLPGHGLSPTLPVLSIEAMATAVMQELNAADIDQFHLLGHSLGGKVAMSMAGQALGEALQRLIVVDIAPKEYPPHHQLILDTLLSIDLAALGDRREADELMRPASNEPGVRAFLLKSLYRTEEGGWAWRFDLQQLARDYTLISQAPPIEKPIEQPVLFIKGGNSDYIEDSDSALIRRVCLDPSFEVIADAGHWLHAEKPDQFGRICQQYLAS